MAWKNKFKNNPKNSIRNQLNMLDKNYNKLRIN